MATQDELEKHFTDHTSAVSKAGLRLVRTQEVVARCVWFLFFVAGSESLQNKVREFIPNIRHWSNHAFDSALLSSRTKSERAAILDMYYKKYEDAVVGAPGNHGMDMVYLLLHIEKDAKWSSRTHVL